MIHHGVIQNNHQGCSWQIPGDLLATSLDPITNLRNAQEKPFDLFSKLAFQHHQVSVIFMRIDAMPDTLYLIFHNAFTGTAATGGFAGAAVSQAIRFGVAKV